MTLFGSAELGEWGTESAGLSASQADFEPVILVLATPSSLSVEVPGTTNSRDILELCGIN